MARISIDPRRNRDGHSPLSAAQQTAIQTAADNAERIAIDGLNVLNRICNQSGRPSTRPRRRRNAWRGNPNVVRWFGGDDLSKVQMKNTQRRMRRIRDEFRKTVRFDLIQHQNGHRSWLCKDNRVAYCSPGTPIKICPNFFRMNARNQAHVIIHEFSHKNGHVHHHGATDFPSALRLAASDPRSARRNPENYGGFCNEYF